MDQTKFQKLPSWTFKYFYFLLFINGKFEDKALTENLNFDEVNFKYGHDKITKMFLKN